jgi:small subunit ribosomal protein S1
VLILEIDAERRRLSLSMKRVEGEAPAEHPDLGLSEEVFSEPRAEAEGGSEESEEGEDSSPASDAAEDLAIAAGGTTADEEPPPESDAAAEAELESEDS